MNKGSPKSQAYYAVTERRAVRAETGPTKPSKLKKSEHHVLERGMRHALDLAPNALHRRNCEYPFQRTNDSQSYKEIVSKPQAVLVLHPHPFSKAELILRKTGTTAPVVTFYKTLRIMVHFLYFFFDCQQVSLESGRVGDFKPKFSCET